MEEIGHIPVLNWSDPVWFRTGADRLSDHGILFCGHSPLSFTQIEQAHANSSGGWAQDLILIQDSGQRNASELAKQLGHRGNTQPVSWLQLGLDRIRDHETTHAAMLTTV